MFTREDWRMIGAGVLAACLGASAVLAQGSCANPNQQVQAAKVERDLCRLRLLAAALEESNPELLPPEGTVRAEIEAAEDALCARVFDGGQAGASDEGGK